MGVRLSDENEICCDQGHQLIGWLSQCSRFSRKRLEVAENTETRLKLYLYTADNRYMILCAQSVVPGGGWYLGCQSSPRKLRPGEDWSRGGSDLADGQFSRELLQEILAEIVFYEAKEIVKPRKPVADVGPVEGPSIQ